jgi:hypothetical protein
MCIDWNVGDFILGLSDSNRMITFSVSVDAMLTTVNNCKNSIIAKTLFITLLANNL